MWCKFLQQEMKAFLFSCPLRHFLCAKQLLAPKSQWNNVVTATTTRECFLSLGLPIKTTYWFTWKHSPRKHSPNSLSPSRAKFGTLVSGANDWTSDHTKQGSGRWQRLSRGLVLAVWSLCCFRQTTKTEKANRKPISLPLFPSLALDTHRKLAWWDKVDTISACVFIECQRNYRKTTNRERRFHRGDCISLSTNVHWRCVTGGVRPNVEILRFNYFQSSDDWSSTSLDTLRALSITLSRALHFFLWVWTRISA